jgi:hypothetical protein
MLTHGGSIWNRDRQGADRRVILQAKYVQHSVGGDADILLAVDVE